MADAGSHVSPFSGSWYPGEPSALRDLLDRLFDESAARTGPCLIPRGVGFVVPHAGLVYSGSTAAAVYRSLAVRPPKRVFLLGFSHSGGRGGVWIPEVASYRTPLGETRVDRRIAEELARQPGFGSLPEEQLCDHSIEIQLPLLRRAAPEALVVPLYVHGLDARAREAAASVLANLAGPDSVFLASTDLTHYGQAFHYQPFPADSSTGFRLRELDEGFIEAAGTLADEFFLSTLRARSATVCGYEPVSLLLATLSRMAGTGEIFQEQLDYRASGEMTGDWQHSVSYAALGYFPADAFHLEEAGAKSLLESARKTLEHYFATGERKPQLAAGGGALDRRAGAFVTLRKNGELRGCVGRAVSETPLRRGVPEMALAAALDDSRFEPVERAEGGLEVEVSVLSPLKRVTGAGAVRVPPHGVLLRAEMGHGLLLPQVATERGWNAEQFLEALTKKSGVTKDVYRDPSSRLFVFQAQVIS